MIIEYSGLGNKNRIVKLKITEYKTISTISSGPHPVSGYQSQLRAVLQKHAACVLLGVDPDTVVSDDGAGRELTLIFRD